jgi:hypothetical protein
MAFATFFITIMMFAAPGQSEKILTNEDVLELIEAGLSSDLVVTMIESSRSEFDTDLTTILELKKREVPDTVLQAMVKAAAAPKPYDPTADNQLLIYVSDSDSWSMSGGFAGGGGSTVGAVAGVTSGGARPQTAEIIKTFRERCPDLEATMEKEKADYFVILDHEGGKGWIRNDNKVVVFDSTGISVYSGSTRSLGNAVKDACNEIREQEQTLASSSAYTR